MRFMHPQLMWLLLAVPVIVFAAWWTAYRRRRALCRFAGGSEYSSRFNGDVSVHRRVVKLLLLVFGLSTLVMAAARPQWGTRMEEVERSGVDLVLILDTSLSMAAEDIAPNRLQYATHAVDSLLKSVAGNRVALVTFAGQASLTCPLTLDHGAVRLFLESMQVEAMQVPGTALAEALSVGLQAFRIDERDAGDRSRAIVLFSDGEDHEGGLDQILGELSDVGVAIHAVGAGTPRGAPIPLRNEAGRSQGYKKDRQDKVVTTLLDETVLERLALDTGGRYYRGTASEVEISEITSLLSEMDAREYGSVLRTRYEERFQIPLLVGLFALIAEALIGDRRRKPARGANRLEAA